ncbi:MAG TPA: sigma-70 family RNA polymerase sigma factor [Terracidiphilus sp.]
MSISRIQEASLGYTGAAVADARNVHGSFEELAMPLFSQLYNFAYWLAGDRAAAEDLVQETYMKALKGFSSFQQGTNFRAWMYRILRNSFLTTQAGLRATVSLEDIDEPGSLPVTAGTPESHLLLRVEQDAIRRALEALPVHHREIVLLCDLEEMSYQEIGQTLGVPIGTVMSRLSRARKAMRALLTDRGEGATQ